MNIPARFKDHYGMVKIPWIMASVAIASALLVGSIVVVVQAFNARNCAYASREYRLPTHYDYWAGCYIKTNGRYVALDKYVAVTQ